MTGSELPREAAAPPYAGLHTLDATALAHAVKARRLGPVEVVAAALERIGSQQPAVNACTQVFAEEALAMAHAVDRALARGSEVGALCGVPIAVKDVIWLAGARATMGTRLLANFVPDEDAAVVRRLRTSGAIIVAKTTNPPFCEFGDTASELFGVTRNPWRLDRTPGGSSGGSGAAVAAGMVPLALGTDMGGSIRIPAAFCGIVGFKPSHGVVPRGPCFEEMRTLNAVGPMARSVRDIALCMDAIAGADAADNLSIPDVWDRHRNDTAEAADGLRVAWSEDLTSVHVDEQVRRSFRTAIAALEGAGWVLEEACPPRFETLTIHLAVVAGERPSFARRRDGEVEERARTMLASSHGRSAADYYDAQLARARYARCWAEFFERFDLILTPTVALAAYGADQPYTASVNGLPIDVDEDGWWELCLPANLTGGPAISLPIGFSDDGLPIGLQVMAPRFQDVRCVLAAAAIEAILPWTLLPPL